MKKILTTILAGTMVAGAAFAVDAKINLQFRSRLDAFSLLSKDDGNGKETTRRDWMNWDNENKNEGYGQYNGTASDWFKFRLEGERAGTIFCVNLGTNNSNLFTLQEFSGWLNFPIGPGTLTLRTGAWKDGYADGNYRVKKDCDAGNIESVDYERFKLGSILTTEDAVNSLTYVDSLSAPAENKALAGFADYGFNVNGDISLNILVGGISKNSFDTTGPDEDGTSTSWNSALAARVQFGMKDVLDAEFIYKKPAPQYNTFALYVMPKILDELTLNVGGAVELNGVDDATDWGVDLRVRYQVMEPLSITFFTNVSGTTLDAGRSIGSGLVGYKGGQGYVTDNNFKVAMWNNLSGRFKINDTFTATLNLGLITPLSKIEKDDTSYAPEWRVTPAVQIYAASNASLWAGVALSGASHGDASEFAISVPVIFRVKM